MTAPAAAPTSGPTAPAAPPAAPQPRADRFAFAAMLDSLPSGATKGGDTIPEKQPHPLDERPQEHSPRGQTTDLSPPNDSALFASLPFALRVGSMMDQRPQAADNSSSPTSPAMKGPKPEDTGASLSAGAKAPAVGRLVGERAFHLGPSTFTGLIANRGFPIAAPFARGVASADSLAARPAPDDESALASGFSPAQARSLKAPVDAFPPIANATAPAPFAPHPGGAALTHRANLTRATAHEAASIGQKPDVSAPPPIARVETSAAVHATAESSSKAADVHVPDSTTSAAPSMAQTDPFGAPSLASFLAGTSFESDASARGVDTDVAPRASTRAGPAPSASPVREIDVDLSPGGLEDVSMTMRLTGAKLSVVIRAASSQTLGSIEGARDAIADRMAAIGQPLDSLIVKQAGVNTDGNRNGNTGGSAEGERRSEQGAGERGGSNDALSRRGPGRDRSF